MKKVATTLFAVAIISVTLFAQKETRTIGSFDRISVGESITVYLTKGNSKEAIIEASGGNTDRVILDNIGGRLKVRMKSGSWRNYNATVYLEFQELESIDVSSSADVIGKSIITSDDLEIEVSSSGSADLEIEVKDLDIEVSSSGKLEVKGSADYQKINVSSSGRYYASNLKSNKVRVEANSSGKAEINASSELDANANSSGRITYSGDPEKIYVNSNSGGSIRKN
jgi:hypothetical protein